jgi:hypothetical protein
MTEAVYDAMGAMLTRWTMGAATAPEAAPWSAELGPEPGEAELRLLALSGQFLSVAVITEPPAGLHLLPDIPALAQPTVPDALRPLVRRILATVKEARAKLELVEFLAARGWTVHPGDWMPAASEDDVPEVYAPWRDWALFPAGAARQQAGGLTAENWDDYWPAARKAALSEIRRRDPAGARLLLEAKLSGEDADARLRLLGLLTTGLSDADAPFLEKLAAGDRAPKVKALAASLLARLGRGPVAGEDLAELKAFFSVQMKGLLRRSRVIQFENIKTPAQRQRRTALFDGVDVTSLAQALGLTPQEMIAAWPWGADPVADHGLATMIARTGTDALVAQTAEVLSQSDAKAYHHLVGLTPRLTISQRSHLAATVLNIAGCRLDMAKSIAGGNARLDRPLATPAGGAVLAALHREDAKPSDQSAELFTLGLLASRDGARQTLEQLNGAGLLQGDPRLDMLRLNAALEHKGEKP